MFLGPVRQHISDGKSWYHLCYLEPLLIPEIFWHAKKSLLRFFGPVRQKKFDGQSWKLSVICNNSRHQKFTETQKSSTRECFGSLSQKILTANCDILRLCIKFFQTRNILKHRRIRLRSFSVMWDNEFPTGTRDTPSFPPSPLLSPPLFSYSFRIPQNFWNRELPYEKFPRVKQHIFEGKSLYSILPPFPLVVINFSDSKHSQQHRRKPSRYFSVLWDNIFPTENRDIPSVISNPYWYPKFSGTQKKVSYDFFGPVKQKNYRKSWNLSLICNNPRYQNFTETQMSSITKYLGTLSQKTFDKKLWCPPLMHKILPYRRLLKHRRIRLRSFSVNWDKEFLTGTRDTPSFPPPPFAPPPSPLVLINLSDTRKFLEHRTPLRKFSVLWDNKSLTGNRYTPSFPLSPLVVINFSDSKHSQQYKRKPSRYFSVLWDKILPTENREIRCVSSNPSWYPKPSGTQKKSPKNFLVL